MSMKLSSLLAALVCVTLSGTSHAALQGRDLDGNLVTSEAYYDTDLNITWLADANYAKTSGYSADGLMDVHRANYWATNLSIVDAVNNITYDNWRLPTVNPLNGIWYVVNYGGGYPSFIGGGQDAGYNISAPGSAYAGSIASEMAFMFYNNLGNSAAFTLAGDATDCRWTEACLDNVGPFSNLQNNAYWSSSTFDGAGRWWLFDMRGGNQEQINYAENFYAWAVSDGDVGIAAIPEPETYAMMLAGLGLVGAATRRRRV